MKRVVYSNLEDWNGEGVASVIGPTGAGKTSYVLQWVRRQFSQSLKHPLLVSLDTVSAYERLDIGSAKPMGSDFEHFSWTGLSFLSPRDQVTLAGFRDHVLPLMEQAISESRPVICVGGSHFYERGVLEGMQPGVASEPQFLATLESQSNEELWKRLNQCDPERAKKLHPNDRYRLMRGLDLSERQRILWKNSQETDERRPWSTIALIVRDPLGPGEAYEAVLRERIQSMFDQGWIEETQAILEDFGSAIPALESVGYRELVTSLQQSQNLIPTPSLIQQIVQSHKSLAKKQRTWVRSLLRGHKF